MKKYTPYLYTWIPEAKQSWLTEPDCSKYSWYSCKVKLFFWFLKIIIIFIHEQTGTAWLLKANLIRLYNGLLNMFKFYVLLWLVTDSLFKYQLSNCGVSVSYLYVVFVMWLWKYIFVSAKSVIIILQFEPFESKNWFLVRSFLVKISN